MYLFRLAIFTTSFSYFVHSECCSFSASAESCGTLFVHCDILPYSAITQLRFDVFDFINMNSRYIYGKQINNHYALFSLLYRKCFAFCNCKALYVPFQVKSYQRASELSSHRNDNQLSTQKFDFLYQKYYVSKKTSCVHFDYVEILYFFQPLLFTSSLPELKLVPDSF